MATNSKIEWTEATWNPVAGCTGILSPGCSNCYAMRLAARLACDGTGKVRRDDTAVGRQGEGWNGVCENMTLPRSTSRANGRGAGSY